MSSGEVPAVRVVSVAIAREAIAAFQTELGTAVSLIPSEPAHAAQDVLTKEEMLRVREVGERVYRKWPVGYGNTSLVVAYYFQCPNNSLPILWADGANNKSDGSALQWSPLFPYRPKTKSRVG